MHPHNEPNYGVSQPALGERRAGVLFLTRWFGGGGVIRYLQLVAPWLVERGHSVTVLAWEISDELSGHPNPYLQTLRENGIPVIRLRWYGRFRLIQMATRLAVVAIRRRTRTIVSLGLEENIIALLAKILLCGRIRTVLHIHNASRLYSINETSPRLLAAARKLFRIADCTIAVSDAIRDDTCKFFGTDPARIITVYNPIPVARIQALAREPLDNLPRNFILGCGKLHELKGFADLIEAFSRMPGSTLKLVILGRGNLRSDLLELAKRLGVAERVIFPGYAPNPYPYFARARAFVLSSHTEAFALVLVEAMACGTPVISSRCEWGPEEILDHGRYGKLYPVGDVQALASALTEVLQDNSNSTAIAREAMERANDFSPDMILPMLEEHIFGS